MIPDENLEDKARELAELLLTEITRDDFIIVRGGIVRNNPSIPIIDLDFLDTRFIDQATLDEAQEVYTFVSSIGLDEIAEEIEEWINNVVHYTDLTPTKP